MTQDLASSEGPPLRVLAWPAPEAHAPNPYIGLLFGAMDRVVVTPFYLGKAAFGEYDVCHIHWPDWAIVPRHPLQAYARLSLLAAGLWVRRLRGTKIVWTVHNLHPHQRHSRFRERILYGILRKLVDEQIHLTKATHTQMLEEHHPCASTPFTVIPHGLLAAPESFPSAHTAKSDLGLADHEHMVLFFGGIDEYKGVQELIRAFHDVDVPNARLFVAGRPSSHELAESLAQAAAADARVTLSLRFQDDQELHTLISAADLVVLPYRRGLNSGSIFLSLGSPTPVLVPATPTFQAVSEDVGSLWVYTYTGALSGENIGAALGTSREADSAKVARRPSVPDWHTIASRTREVYARRARSKGRLEESSGSS